MSVEIATTYRVYYRAEWGDQWIYDENLYPTGALEQLAAPDYGTATIRRDIGEIKRENWTGFFQVFPIDLVGKFILVKANYAGNEWVAFIGVVTDQSDTLLNDATLSGDQQFTAREVAWLLDRQTIYFSYVMRNGQQFTSDRVYDFNERSENGLKLRGNKSLTTDSNGIHRFGDEPEDEGNPLTIWNSYQASRYLLKLYNWSGRNLGGIIPIIGQISAMIARDSWSVSGNSFWEALCQIIHRRYGLGFHLSYTEASNSLFLNVWTTTDKPITFESATVPANAFQTTFTIPPSFPFNHVVDAIQMRLTSTTSYDSIMVRGNFLKATATYSFRNVLREGWTSELEEEYNDPGGDDEEEDDYRRAMEKFDSVFTKYVIPRTWNGKLTDVEGQNAEADLMFTNFAFMGKAFQRDLPFKVGWDYTGATPVNNNPLNNENEYHSIMAWIWDSFDGDEHEATEQWIPIDRISQVLPDVNVSITARPLAKSLGFEVNCSPNHLLGGDYFLEESLSSRKPEFSYRQLAFTATVQLDIRLEASQGIPGMNIGSALVIERPDLEAWFIHPYTCVGITPDGNLALYGGPSYLRDDESKLYEILAAAVAWYGQIRQAISIPLKRVDYWVRLGSYLTGIVGQSLSVPVRAPVTAKRIYVDTNTMVVETGWLSKDFGPDFGRMF